MRLALSLLLAIATSAAAQSPVTGDWHGTLDVGATQLHLVLHVTAAPDSTLHATMDSVEQQANGIPVTTITFTENKLNFGIANLHASYAGTLNAAATEIDGTFTQGQAFPLNFTRTTAAHSAPTAAPAPKRPQNPVPPFPYRSEDLTYTNSLQHDTLAATLTIPPGKGPFPAVLLITGSGPQDRDETLLGHKPFLVLSDYLTRHGIVVLRADDRGIAKSTGDFATATTADFATDVEAGIALLKSRPEVDPHRIGLIGHSEGAIIAPMVAARNRDVGFIVMLAGSSVPGDQLIVEQLRLITIASGVSPETAQQSADAERKILTLIETEKDHAALERQLHAQLDDKMSPPAVDAQIKALTSPWYLYFLTYDPAPALRQLRIPVLALAGSKDLQVPPQQNLPGIRAALSENKNAHVEIDELPGLNHLFQTATTGSPSEYANIEETIAPVALEKIASWIVSLPSA
jgi:fermentation-respiration switch protein FrsA (DUF1100 family)